MKLEETHYDAFISYRHSDTDMFVAKTLHRELEAFRLPKNLIKKLGPENTPKTRICRVFRDQEELPISSNLKEPILQALTNSDFLIVICTPRLPESVWCRTEIEQFISMHGRDRILAVLAEGEPQEAFPEQLRFVEENGVRREIEPLAADVRGATRREMRRKIKAETVRLAAPIFDCGYDDLRQRHRERRLKRIAAAAAVAAAICFAFGAVGMGMAMRIQKQSVQIASQKAEIEEQYTEALRTGAKAQAEEALRILETGDRVGAVQTALDVFPGPATPEIPYTPQAQYALTQSLGVYEDETRVLPRHMLHHDAAVSFMKSSPDGRLLLTADKYGKLYVWDALAARLLYEEDDSAKINLSSDTAGFLDDNRIFYPEAMGMGVYDISRGEAVSLDNGQSYYKAAVSGDGGRYALLHSGEITVYDSGNYEQICSVALPEENEWESYMVMDERGEKLAIAWKGRSEDWQDERFLSILDLEKQETAVEYALDRLQVDQLSFADGRLFAAGNILEGSENAGVICCFGLQENEGLQWSREGKILNSFTVFQTGEGGRLLLNGYDTLTLLGEDTGEVIGEAVFGETIVSAVPDESGKFAGVRLRNGEYHYLNFTDMSDLNLSWGDSFKAVPDDLEDSVMGESYMASYSYNSTGIVIHATAGGSRMERLLEDVGYINGILVREDESAALIWSSDGVTALELNSGRILWSAEEWGEPVVNLSYLGDGQEQLAVALLEGIVFLDAATGEKEGELRLDGLDLSVLEFSEDGSQFALARPWSIGVYDTVTGKELKQDGHLEEIESAGEVALSEDLKTYAVACPASRELQLFEVGKEQPVKSIPLNAACVENIVLCAGEDKLFVTYVDKRAEAYSLSDGSLLRSYSDLPFEVEKASGMGGNGILLSGTDGSCAVDDEGEPLALLASPCAAAPGRGLYLTVSGGELLSFPVYDADMLREEAEKLLRPETDN